MKFAFYSGGPTDEFSWDRCTPHQHKNRWTLEQTKSGPRVTLAPSANPVELLWQLCRELPPPYWILYVLVAPRGDQSAGRYQSPMPLEPLELATFLRKYETFFQEDGRHHLWVTSAADYSTIVYDKHEVIYVYGADDIARAVAMREGLMPGPITMPTPHMHGYWPEWDDAAQALLAEYEWKVFPLVPDQDE